MKATVQDCLRMREFYFPHVAVAGGLECISYPFPRSDGGIGIMVRERDDPMTIREASIPESDWQSKSIFDVDDLRRKLVPDAS